MALCIAPEKNFYDLEMYGLLFFLMLAYLLAMYNKNGLGLKKWIPGIIGLLFLFCAGFQLARAGMSIRSPQHFSKHRWRLLYIQVNSVPENRGKRIRFQERALFRSEERREGEECVRTRRYRWAPDNKKQKYITKKD